MKRYQRQEYSGYQLIKYDRANLEGYVAVGGDGDRATIWRFFGYKDWLDGGKIKFDAQAPYVAAEMLASNASSK